MFDYFTQRNLVQYDCGKLHKLSILLKTLKAKGSKVLIFTQMTKMLNPLEQFLNLHGYTYIRPDGSVKVELTYVHGKEQGAVKSYYPDGTLQEESVYMHGKKEGVEKSYYPNGNVKKETFYRNGMRTGQQRWYDEKGRLWKQRQFSKDRVQSRVKESDKIPKSLSIFQAR